jgi:hypothetical protein
MSNINWNKPFYFNPATGLSSSSPSPGAIAFPTYGHYGGGDYSAGTFGGTLLTKSDGSAYSYKELVTIGNNLQDPVDQLDYLFYRHDVASAAAGPGYSSAQAQADISLLQSLTKLDAHYDPEASLYAGFVSLAMIGDLAIHNDLNMAAPRVLLAGLKDAASDIQYGLEHLPAQEFSVAAAAGVLHATNDPDVFTFDFSITTHSVAQEAVEMLAMNALNADLDLGEKDYAPLHTGFPFPGTTDYQFSYDVVTHDWICTRYSRREVPVQTPGPRQYIQTHAMRKSARR